MEAAELQGLHSSLCFWEHLKDSWEDPSLWPQQNSATWFSFLAILRPVGEWNIIFSKLACACVESSLFHFRYLFSKFPMALKICLLILTDSQDFPKDGELCPITPEEG